MEGVNRMKGFVQGLYTLCEWIMRLAILNILWVIFTLVGGVVLGLFPSTISLFEIARKYQKGEWDTPIFSHFFSAYKKNFLKGNRLGLILITAGTVLFIDWHLFSAMNGLPFQVLAALVVVLAILYVIVLLHIFPIYVLHEFTIMQCIKYACVLGVYRPLSTIGIGMGGILLYLIFSTFQPVLFFFGASLTSMVIMWISGNTIINMKKKSTHSFSADKAV
ncbi:YesV [Bacillus sp. NRRL B-14911]|nr:YesV [Bacillus sp. NRRL B-14911]